MEKAKEYDLYVDVNKEDIHLITYLLEGADHLMSVRKIQDNGLLKIIVPEYFLDEVVLLVKSLNSQNIRTEVISIEPHNGIV